jgi:hypothetical protein
LYAPTVIKADEIERFKIGTYEAIMLGNIQARGMIQYLYILEIRDENGPCLYITSEVNAMKKELGGGSHFLCIFEGERHLNLGDSDEWANLDVFKGKAIELARKNLGI